MWQFDNASNEWANKGRFKPQNGSSRHRTITERGDIAIATSAVRAPDSSLSTIRRDTRACMSNMIIDKTTTTSMFASTITPLDPHAYKLLIPVTVVLDSISLELGT